MENIKKRVTNPMTVIALFATLSETSAAISLPFLDNDDRDIYIWFLISFPFYLLFLFFATLNFNYRSLYAPSDFEKGEHFIKVLENAEQSENKKKRTPINREPVFDGRSTHRPANAQDPPAGQSSDSRILPLRHVRLPERLKDLYLIDARWITEAVEFNQTMARAQSERGKTARVIVFLTCTESQISLEDNAAEYSKQVRKRCRSTFCVAYNLNSQGLAVIDLPTDAKQPVVVEDQSERNDEKGVTRN